MTKVPRRIVLMLMAVSAFSGAVGCSKSTRPRPGVARPDAREAGVTDGGCSSSADATVTTCSMPETVWSGTLSYAGDSTPISFTLAATGGELSGTQTLIDPVSQASIKAGPVTGRMLNGRAEWSSLGKGIRVTGRFANDRFLGTAELAAIDGGVIHVSISLQSPTSGQ